MSECTCPLAGYCERHGLEKNEHWHHLCQTKESYRAAWDAGYGPGQGRKPLTSAQLERKARIHERVAARDRLIDWLRSLRHPGEVGVGDTAHRLCMRSCNSPDAHAALERLLKQCSCSRVDAVERLNRSIPYPANTLNRGGS